MAAVLPSVSIEEANLFLDALEPVSRHSAERSYEYFLAEPFVSPESSSGTDIGRKFINLRNRTNPDDEGRLMTKSEAYCIRDLYIALRRMMRCLHQATNLDEADQRYVLGDLRHLFVFIASCTARPDAYPQLTKVEDKVAEWLKTKGTQLPNGAKKAKEIKAPNWAALRILLYRFAKCANDLQTTGIKGDAFDETKIKHSDVFYQESVYCDPPADPCSQQQIDEFLEGLALVADPKDDTEGENFAYFAVSPKLPIRYTVLYTELKRRLQSATVGMSRVISILSPLLQYVCRHAELGVGVAARFDFQQPFAEAESEALVKQAYRLFVYIAHRLCHSYTINLALLAIAAKDCTRWCPERHFFLSNAVLNTIARLTTLANKMSKSGQGQPTQAVFGAPLKINENVYTFMCRDKEVEQPLPSISVPVDDDAEDSEDEPLAPAPKPDQDIPWTNFKESRETRPPPKVSRRKPAKSPSPNPYQMGADDYAMFDVDDDEKTIPAPKPFAPKLAFASLAPKASPLTHKSVNMLSTNTTAFSRPPSTAAIDDDEDLRIPETQFDDDMDADADEKESRASTDIVPGTPRSDDDISMTPDRATPPRGLLDDDKDEARAFQDELMNEDYFGRVNTTATSVSSIPKPLLARDSPIPQYAPADDDAEREEDAEMDVVVPHNPSHPQEEMNLFFHKLTGPKGVPSPLWHKDKKSLVTFFNTLTHARKIAFVAYFTGLDYTYAPPAEAVPFRWVEIVDEFSSLPDIIDLAISSHHHLPLAGKLFPLLKKMDPALIMCDRDLRPITARMALLDLLYSRYYQSKHGYTSIFPLSLELPTMLWRLCRLKNPGYHTIQAGDTKSNVRARTDLIRQLVGVDVNATKEFEATHVLNMLYGIFSFLTNDKASWHQSMIPKGATRDGNRCFDFTSTGSNSFTKGLEEAVATRLFKGKVDALPCRLFMTALRTIPSNASEMIHFDPEARFYTLQAAVMMATYWDQIKDKSGDEEEEEEEEEKQEEVDEDGDATATED